MPYRGSRRVSAGWEAVSHSPPLVGRGVQEVGTDRFKGQTAPLCPDRADNSNRRASRSSSGPELVFRLLVTLILAKLDRLSVFDPTNVHFRKRFGDALPPRVDSNQCDDEVPMSQDVVHVYAGDLLSTRRPPFDNAESRLTTYKRHVVGRYRLGESLQGERANLIGYDASL
jgi:hypothetical protein